MSLAVTEDFVRDAWDLIACHSPLVLKATLGNGNATASSGEVTVEIQAVSAGADDTTLYTFDMAYVETTGSFDHFFRLDITDIIRKICNEPGHVDETAATHYKEKSKRATEIDIDVKSDGEDTVSVDNWYMHGFNQVNNPDSSCLVDFADVATKAIISIVPGVPMLYYLWIPSNIGGTNIFRLYDSGDNLLRSEALPDPVVFGLIQVYISTIGAALQGAWKDKIEEFYFTIFNTTIQHKVFGVAFKLACEGDVVLAWLNRYGTYSYMAFERFPTHRGEQRHLGEFNITVDDLADVQSRTKSRGYEKVRTVISAVAKGIPIEYMEVVEDLFYSMDVYYFTGTLPKDSFDAAEWLRVTVRGTLVERKKHSHENVRVDVMLPEKYTQVR
jgi:hypothetical protein